MNNELFRQSTAILRGMWLQRWRGLAVAWGFAVIGSAALILIPDRYESTARVYVDTQSVLKPLMSGLTVQPDIDQQVSMLGRTLITRPNVDRMLQTADVAVPSGLSDSEHDKFVDRVIREIKVTGGGRENLFNISYRDVDPQKAQRLVQTLVTFFVESGVGGKRRDTDSARQFIDEQIKTYEAKLEEAEGRLKSFKIKNFGYTASGTGQDYFARVSALNDELHRLRSELRAADESRDAYKRQLAGEEPVLLTDAPAQSGGVPEIDTRLDAQRKQLDELLRRYTESHPDVASTRRLVAELEDQRQRELDRRRRAAGAATHGTTATNPVFQQIKVSLADAEANVASLRARVADAQGRYNELRAVAGHAPQVEAEMTQLNRDYDVMRKNYEALVARRESAKLSGSVDATAKLTEFRVIEPPRTSATPVFPQRTMLFPAVLIASLAAGAAATFALSRIFPTVQTVRELRALVGDRLVLGSVSLNETALDLKHARIANFKFASLLLLPAFAYAAWFATTLFYAHA